MDFLTKAVQLLNWPQGCKDCSGRGFTMVRSSGRGPGMNLRRPEKCSACKGTGLPQGIARLVAAQKARALSAPEA